MRVHQLAKEYDKKSSDFLTEIQGYGIDASSHLSGLNDDEVATIRQKIGIKEVAIKLESEVLARLISNQAGKSEEHFATYSDEDRLEGEEDTAVNVNVKTAGDAREKYADTVKNITKNQEDWHVVTPKKEEDSCIVASVDAEILREEEMTPLPEDVEEESKTEEFNGVEVDEQLNPVDEMEDGEEETDTELSFGQKAFAKAMESENDEDAVEIQEVEVERPKGIWGWFKGLFS